MITIAKTREPESWRQRRHTPGAVYEATDDLRESLIKEQGYICAYCMRRIGLEQHNTRIEHILPQTLITTKEAMNYGNMVLCCDGCMSGTEKEMTHCDRHKGDDVITISPFDSHLQEKISYKRDGTITSPHPEIEKDLNTTLNLNIPLLKLNRKNVREGLIKQLDRKAAWKKADLERILARYSYMDNQGMLIEYCGVVRDYISKKLRQK